MATRRGSRKFGHTETLPSGTVRAKYADPHGQVQRQSFSGLTAQRDADRWLQAAEIDIARGHWADQSKSTTLFRVFAEEHYFPTRTHARTTRARDMVWYRTYIEPHWGPMQLRQIDSSRIDKWLAQLQLCHVRGDPKKPLLAPATVWDIFVVFRKIVLAAVSREYLVRSPIPGDIDKVLPVKRNQKAERFLTEAEVVALAKAMDERWRVLIYVGAYGGLRLGELGALRVNDFDFLRGTVYVDEAVTDVDGVLDYGDPKSRAKANVDPASIRTVSLPDDVMAMAKDHIERTVGWDEPYAFLFASAKGNPFRANNWRSRYFNAAVEASGIERLTPNDLRHTAASFWIADGASLLQVAQRLGHESLAMVKRYTHLLPETDQALRERQNDRFARGQDTEANVVALRPKVSRRKTG